MQFIVKFFPEITIKSKPVRQQFVRQLQDNLRGLLTAIDSRIEVKRDWDKIVVSAQQFEGERYQEIVDCLSCTPGIAYFLDVRRYRFIDKADAAEKVLALWQQRLEGHSFVVRCKRSGQHEFNSHQLEQYIGGVLNQRIDTARVDLHQPDYTVQLELRGDELDIVEQRYAGLGGFPLGSLDPVLSLMSGGFDSTVASYLTMKRGMRTHFCFFNLGGRDHEVGVKEIALYLWMKFGASSRVKFIAVDFEPVVAEILRHVHDSQMGVILKRMMLRAASALAEKMNIEALVTGESVAQVSSQTLRNLSVIDSVTDTLVLRPLITMDKDDIIKLSRRIGAEAFAAAMPEYCGVISVKPTTRAKPEKIAAEEQRFDFALLDQAVATARIVNIDALADEEIQRHDVESMSVPLADAVVIDVRHPSEEERKPLRLTTNTVLTLPFYELHTRFAELDQAQTYMLYCDKGVMSRLHASHLLEQGYSNVKVYRPE